MNGIFDLNSKFMQTLSSIGDFILLNLCFFVCCVPVVTIGAAKTALYRASFDMLDNRGNLYRRFFKTYAHEIKSTLPTLLIRLAVLALLGWELLIVAKNAVPFQRVFLIGLLLALWLIFSATSSIYAQVSRFSATTAQYWKNAFYIALTHPLQSLAIGFMDLLPPLMVFGVPTYAAMMGPVWLFLYFSVTTMFAARMLRKPFDYYIEQFEEENEK